MEVNISQNNQELIKELQERELIYQFTGKSLENIFNKKRTAYIGMDPTAKSIHVGYLVPIMLARTLMKYGHEVIVLLGGFTAQIGDPSGKSKMRATLDPETVQKNSENLMKLINRFFPECKIVNNADWLSKINLTDFLSNCARYVSMNSLIKQESFANRLRAEQPLSMLEICYPVLQGYDFAHLYKHEGCSLQFGGSDQWSNILQGVDYISRMDSDADVQAFTCPLLLNSAGEKMGKTVSGAVWLDEENLPVYDFWQYWRNIDDDSARKYLKILVDIPFTEKEEILKQDINDIKKFLATYLTAFVHSKEKAEEAEMQAAKIFESDDLSDIETREIKGENRLCDICYQIGWCKSVGEAKKAIPAGGFRIDNEEITDPTHLLKAEQTYLLNRGKKKFIKIKVVN